jgi:hypothetical protein
LPPPISAADRTAVKPLTPFCCVLCGASCAPVETSVRLSICVRVVLARCKSHELFKGPRVTFTANTSAGRVPAQWQGTCSCSLKAGGRSTKSTNM